MARMKQTTRKSYSGKGKVLDPSSVRPPATTKKKRVVNAGIVAMRAIRKAQKSTDLCMPKLSFSRLVREIAQGRGTDLRFTPSAMLALQVKGNRR